MPNFSVSLSFRDAIQDPAVIEELDRLYARLNGFLAGIGQNDAEADTIAGTDRGTGVQLTSFANLSGPFVLPVTAIALSSNIANLDPGDATVLRITATGAARTIQGIRGGTNGRLLLIYAPSTASFALTLAHNASAADADKRIQLVGAADLASVASEVRGWILQYDATAKQWVQLGGSAVVAAAVHRARFQSGTQTGTDANTTEKDLWTGTIPANTFAANGDCVRIHAFGNFADNSSGKQLRFYYAGTLIANTGAQAWQDLGWQCHVLVIRRGVASQALHAQFIPAIAGVSAQPGEFATSAADETAGIAIRISGQNSVATANDITFEGGMCERIAAAS